MDEGLWSAVYGGQPPKCYREFHPHMLANVDEATRNTLAALRLINRAAVLPAGSSEDLRLAIARLIQQGPKTLRLQMERQLGGNASRSKLQGLYVGLVNAGMNRPHFGLTLTNGKAEMAIYCSDLNAAAFAWAATNFFDTCPACGRLYAPNPARPKQKSCSARCAQVLAQRAYRKRESRKRR